MLGKAESCALVWDFAVPESLTGTQAWLLSAMQRNGRELITMLWRILGNEQDLCDVYQSTFLRLAHYDFGQKPENVRAYLFRSAANIAVSMLRRRIIEKKNLANAQADRVVNSPAGELDARQLQESLRCCIAQLPEHLRTVVTLHDLAELPYAQVAKILKIKPATARVYRCKAVRLLAVWMKKEEV